MAFSELLKLIKEFPKNLVLVLRMFRANSVRLVIGYGGFPSFLPMAVSRLVGLPCFVFEQNAKVGLANKASTLVASQIFAVPGANAFFKRKITVI